MIKSNTKAFYVYKYAFLVLSLMLFFILGIAMIDPTMIEGNIDFASSINKVVLSVLGIFSFVVFLFVNSKMALVELSNDRLEIKSGSNSSINIEWKEVKAIKQVFTLRPPLYVLRLKNGKSFLFSTGYDFISINGFTIDRSNMKKYFEREMNKKETPTKRSL